MTSWRRLHLRTEVRVRREPSGVVLSFIDRSLRLSNQMFDLLDEAGLLDGRGKTTDEFLDSGIEADRLAVLFLLLERLRAQRFIQYNCGIGGQSLGIVLPLSAAFEFRKPSNPPGALVLSRFAAVSSDSGRFVLDSAVEQCRLCFASWEAGSVALFFASPQTRENAISGLPFAPGHVDATLDLLLETGFVQDAAAVEPEALGAWEPHEVAFHWRSRRGRHLKPIGAIFRRDRPEPGSDIPPGCDLFPLRRPDVSSQSADDSAFSSVLERRKSIRGRGDVPISLARLEQFLHISTHARQRSDVATSAEWRIYPSGGGSFEIRFSLAVMRCDGLEPGFYAYDPRHHVLGRLTVAPQLWSKMLSEAVFAADHPWTPDVLIVLSSRLGELSWKYSGMSYRTTLLNAGAIIQTMYLAATALRLAPCARGNGDSELFSLLTGRDWLEETAIAEFGLSEGSPY